MKGLTKNILDTHYEYSIRDPFKVNEVLKNAAEEHFVKA